MSGMLLQACQTWMQVGKAYLVKIIRRGKPGHHPPCLLHWLRTHRMMTAGAASYVC